MFPKYSQLGTNCSHIYYVFFFSREFRFNLQRKEYEITKKKGSIMKITNYDP